VPAQTLQRQLEADVEFGFGHACLIELAELSCHRDGDQAECDRVAGFGYRVAALNERTERNRSRREQGHGEPCAGLVMKPPAILPDVR
jgi:hypothetical protein